MAMTIANALLSTLELRAGSVITETEIAAMKKRLGPNRQRRVHSDACEQLERLQDALPMQISDEQAKKGLDYLRKLLLRKDGTLRDTALIRDQGLADDTHGQVIRTLDHFLFTGFHEDCNDVGCVVRMYPIYRAMAHNGPWFEYVARPWVAGLPTFGQLFEVLE